MSKVSVRFGNGSPGSKIYRHDLVAEIEVGALNLRLLR